MSTWILGVSALYHDSAAALLKDGVLVAAASEERFSRLKHDASLPVLAARWCLEQAGIQARDLDHLVYYEKPLRKFERILVHQVLHFPKSFTAFRRSTFNWLTDKLWVKSALVSNFGVHPDKVLFCDHHRSHAASAFYCSPFDEAAVLTVDGVGEWATTSLYKAEAGKGLRLLQELRFPHSIGLVYSAFTAWLGFLVNDGEYKVMGMAPYGEPRFEAEVRKVLRLHDDGAFDVDTKYVSYHHSATDSYTAAFEALFGPARFPGADFDPTDPAHKRYADVAASIQRVTEDALVGLTTALHREAGSENLCLAGGVALNSVANRQILLRSPFQRLFIQPAAGDAGGAIGAALWAWNEVLGRPRAPAGLRPDLGRAWTDEEIGATLRDLRLPAEHHDEEALITRAADDIAAGKVIGWVQGGFEWGPRALGHRSILANPADPAMKDRVNERIKFRELFRPFAPACAAEQAWRYFDVPKGGEGPAGWMLLVCPVKEGVAELLPATTHVDGSARVQLVRADQSPLFHRLLDAVGERTGAAVALNTSFNLKGEPIVSSPVHALATFLRSGLDALYLGGWRIEKKELSLD